MTALFQHDLDAKDRRPSLSATAGVTKSRHDSGTFDEETRRKSSARIDVRYVAFARALFDNLCNKDVDLM